MLKPVIGYGFNEANGKYECNRDEEAFTKRGASCWLKMGFKDEFQLPKLTFDQIYKLVRKAQVDRDRRDGI